MQEIDHMAERKKRLLHNKLERDAQALAAAQRQAELAQRRLQERAQSMHKLQSELNKLEGKEAPAQPVSMPVATTTVTTPPPRPPTAPSGRKPSPGGVRPFSAGPSPGGLSYGSGGGSVGKSWGGSDMMMMSGACLPLPLFILSALSRISLYRNMCKTESPFTHTKARYILVYC